jgi:poly[(R)-3-hydroxyalkanoate] polymerase subunit PhaC
MPAKMRSFNLRHIYMKNLLAMAGGIEPDGVPIELSRVKLPAYFVSTVEDRIAPWKTTYKGAKHAKYESQAQQDHDRAALMMILSTSRPR